MIRTFARSLFLKYFAILLVLLMVLFSTVTYFVSNALFATVAASKFDNLSSALTAATRYINLYIENFYSTLLLAAQDSALSSHADLLISKTLEGYVSGNIAFDNLYLRYPDGRVICADQYIFDAMKYQLPDIHISSDTLTIVLSDAYFSRMIQGQTVALATRISSDDNGNTILIAEMKTDNLLNNIKAVLGEGLSFAVLTNTGKLLGYNLNKLNLPGQENFETVRPDEALLAQIRTYALGRISSPIEYSGIMMLTGIVTKPDWQLVLMIDSTVYRRQIQESSHDIVRVMYLCLPFLVLICLIISKGYTVPIQKLSRNLDRINNFEEISISRRLQSRSDEIGSMARSVNHMLERLSFLVRKERDSQKARSQLETKLLQNQISPHFLCNILSCVTALLLRHEHEQALNMLRQLIRISNYGIDRLNDKVLLRDELDFIKTYCDIQRMRKGNAFELIIQVSTEAMNRIVPKLFLQPFVENALYHGFAENTQGQCIRITSSHQDDKLVIDIWNNGIDMETQQIEQFNTQLALRKIPQGNKGIGILNSSARIRLIYGEPYGVKLSSKPGNGFTAHIILPWAEQ